MMQRRGDPDWDLVWMHMSHQESRDKSEYWTKATNRIVDRLRTAIRLSDPEEIQLVKAILGIHLVNDFEITPYQPNRELGYETTEGVQVEYLILSTTRELPGSDYVIFPTGFFTGNSNTIL